MMIHLDLHDWQGNYVQVKIILHQIMQDAAAAWRERKSFAAYILYIYIYIYMCLKVFASFQSALPERPCRADPASLTDPQTTFNRLFSPSSHFGGDFALH